MKSKNKRIYVASMKKLIKPCFTKQLENMFKALVCMGCKTIRNTLFSFLSLQLAFYVVTDRRPLPYTSLEQAKVVKLELH